MIRKMLFIVFMLVHFGGMAQDTPIDTSKYGADMIIDPIEYAPTMLNCEELELNKLRACNAEEISKIIRSNVLLPNGFDTIDIKVKVYVSFTVDTNAQVSEIEIVRGAEYYFSEAHQKFAKELNTEAKRVVGLFKFTKPAQMHGKDIRQLMTVPISFSNPEKTDSTKGE